MCGIAGILNEERSLAETKIIKMLAQIEHRGNNNYEYKVFDDAVLGTNRLAIVDRANAKQPISSRDGRFTIVLNGEIYNYKTLKAKLVSEGYRFQTDSDTETLLAGYIKWGVKILDEIVGMYAFVIYDNFNKSFFVARDIIGVKPLYFAETNKGVIFFASEIKQLAIFPEIKEIKELEPGHFFENSLKPQKYFELKRKRIFSDEDFVRNKLSELFDNAVKIRVDTDLPIGVQVSGGIDSTAILAVAIKYHKDVTAIIVGAEGSEDAVFAERYCKENNIKYIKQIEPKEQWIEHWNELMEQAIYTGETIEPNPVRNMPMNMIASKLAKDHGLKIVLLGEGADELCAGYPEFREELDMEVVSDKLNRFISGLHRTQIQRVDRASMFYTVENRTPFFDRNFVEFVLQVDPRLFLRKMENGQVQEKYILRQAVKDILPEYIYNRPKLAFNAGTGMGSNGPDHKAQLFLEEKYSNLEYEKDKVKLAKQIKFFNVSNKIETYLLKRALEYGYGKAKFMRNRVAANGKNVPNQKF